MPRRSLLITGLDILQATLSAAQGRARSSSGRTLLIQCGEGADTGITTASEQGADGKPLPIRFLYNHVNKRKVDALEVTAPLYPTACKPGVRAYVDGSVMVLCSSTWWQTIATRKSSRPISAIETLAAIEKNGKLKKGDKIGRIQDLSSFSFLHELMHWGTWDLVNGYTVGDSNGYEWDDIIAGFSKSPANSAQFYSFLCYGTLILYSSLAVEVFLEAAWY